MFSRSEKYIASKEETDNTPTDNTKQVTSGMKQGLRTLSFKTVSFLKKLNNKYSFVSL